MLGVREKFSLGRSCLEMGDLSEVEVKAVVLTFVFYGQDHVSAIVAAAFTEAEGLLVDFYVRVNRTCHHLNFEINVLDTFATLAKLHYGKCRVVFWLDLILFKALGICHLPILFADAEATATLTVGGSSRLRCISILFT